MKKILGIIGIIVACIALRLFPHAPNVAPMTALALFSGYAVSSRWGISIAPLATLATDFILGFYEWQVMLAVYGSYVIIALMGAFFNAGKSSVRAISATFAGALIFFLLTNGAVWSFSMWYEKSLAGLISAYINGLPFLRNSLLGDLGYSALFYAGYALYRARAPVIARLLRLLMKNKNLIATR